MEKFEVTFYLGDTQHKAESYLRNLLLRLLYLHHQQQYYF
jgi:hypothetical protein